MVFTNIGEYSPNYDFDIRVSAPIILGLRLPFSGTMVRQVYGKRSTRAAFTVSNIFTESSPTKTASRPTTRDENSDVEIAGVLEKLRIADEEDEPPVRRRRALVARNGNSGQVGKKSKSVTKRAINQTIHSEESLQTTDLAVLPERKIQRDQVTKRIALPSPPSTESLKIDCDPYIAPLVALTNDQKAPLDFSTWSEALTPHFAISKIAEASYSEVYRLSLLTSHPTLTSSDESVLKLLALKPTPSNLPKTKAQERKEQDMSNVQDVASEVQLLKRMTEIPGFTNYRALHVLKGRPCKAFIRAWKEWNKGRSKEDKSTFPDPSRKGGYSEEQHWAVIEMQDAGTDAEKCIDDDANSAPIEDHISVRSIWATWDIFWQVVLAVAKGETEAKFEHRDLHLGNICVRREEGEKFVLVEDFESRNLHFTNLEVTIIDYTLSRANMVTVERPKSSHSSSSASTGSSSDSEVVHEIAFNPLQSQPKIFKGDAEEDYQYEIYRHMRSLVLASEASRRKRSDGTSQPWEAYKPITNVLWLHFVLHRLCESIQWPSELADPQLGGPTTRTKKTLDMEYILRDVLEVLHIDRVMEKAPDVASAVELVGLAVQNAWLGEKDILS